jgi:hypothetical protein
MRVSRLTCNAVRYTIRSVVRSRIEEKHMNGLHQRNEEAKGHGKIFTLIVNGRKREVPTDDLSFDAVIALAFSPVPTDPNVMFTVTYRHGPHANPQGSLLEGQSVEIKNEMVFNVTQTNKS